MLHEILLEACQSAILGLAIERTLAELAVKMSFKVERFHLWRFPDIFEHFLYRMLKQRVEILRISLWDIKLILNKNSMIITYGSNWWTFVFSSM